MDASHQALVNELADQADELLADCRSAAEARATLKETLPELHPGLAPRDAEAVIAGVLRILQGEGFFDGGPRGGDAAGDDGDPEDE